jgi:hypothetical protein
MEVAFTSLVIFDFQIEIVDLHLTWLMFGLLLTNGSKTYGESLR